jgi:hypothetical protein
MFSVDEQGRYQYDVHDKEDVLAALKWAEEVGNSIEMQQIIGGWLYYIAEKVGPENVPSEPDLRMIAINTYRKRILRHEAHQFIGDRPTHALGVELRNETVERLVDFSNRYSRELGATITNIMLDHETPLIEQFYIIGELNVGRPRLYRLE